MMDALIASLPNGYGLPMTERRQPVAKHERTWGGNAMYRVYETKDGKFVALGGAELKFATNLLSALGRPDLIPLCRLPPGPGQDPVRDFLTETFSTRTQAEWVDWMAGKDIAFAPVKTLREGLDDLQARHRAMVVEDARGWEHLGVPIKLPTSLAGPFDSPATASIPRRSYAHWAIAMRAGRAEGRRRLRNKHPSADPTYFGMRDSRSRSACRGRRRPARPPTAASKMPEAGCRWRPPFGRAAAKPAPQRPSLAKAPGRSNRSRR